MSETVAWLIERQEDGGPLFYWCRSPWGLMWLSTSEPHQSALDKAVRFGRRQDAEAVASELGIKYTRVADHMWVDSLR